MNGVRSHNDATIVEINRPIVAFAATVSTLLPHIDHRLRRRE
ncbi:MAG: hypothetical protein ABI585_01675 [Betaproteobacteria bacterium]